MKPQEDCPLLFKVLVFREVIEWDVIIDIYEKEGYVVSTLKIHISPWVFGGAWVDYIFWYQRPELQSLVTIKLPTLITAMSPVAVWVSDPSVISMIAEDKIVEADAWDQNSSSMDAVYLQTNTPP